MFVRVAVNIPTDRTFVYRVPPKLEADAAPGKRVLVPFGGRTLAAYILELMPATDYPETKDVIRLLDTEPLFGAADLLFYQWIADYYLQPIGKVLAEALPSGINPKTNRIFRLIPHAEPVSPEHFTVDEMNLLTFLQHHSEGVTGAELGRILPAKALKKGPADPAESESRGRRGPDETGGHHRQKRKMADPGQAVSDRDYFNR